MDVRSAGVIVRRDGKYLLLHYDAGHWDFPKGHIEKGETEEQAALRELKEETGLSGSIVQGFNHKIAYFYTHEGKRLRKEVTFFIARADAGNVVLSSEHKKFEWLPFDDALKRVTFDSAREVLRAVRAWLDDNE